jgi:hypothetical protein
MYTELHANTPELMAKIKEVGKANPTWAYGKIWQHIQQKFPELINPNPAHEPSTPAVHQFSFTEKPRAKTVSCVGMPAEGGGLIIFGAFANPIA